MTDLEQFREFFDKMGVPHWSDTSTPSFSSWNPEESKIYKQSIYYNARNVDEVSIRELNDKRKVFVIGVASGCFLFDENEKFKGTVSDDDIGEYKPNTKGGGYWSMPPIQAQHLERPI